MKIRFGILTVLTLCTSLLASVPVYAHVLQSNNGISAEMHLPPQDVAVAGRLQRIEFIFGGEDNPSTFSLIECGCSLKIAPRDGAATTISTQFDNSAGEEQLTSQTTFQAAGDYTLTLNGYTTASHSKQFNLVYNLNVQPAPRTVSTATRKLTMAVIGLCVLAALGVLAYHLRRESSSSAKPEE